MEDIIFVRLRLDETQMKEVNNDILCFTSATVGDFETTQTWPASGYLGTTECRIAGSEACTRDLWFTLSAPICFFDIIEVHYVGDADVYDSVDVSSDDSLAMQQSCSNTEAWGSTISCGYDFTFERTESSEMTMDETISNDETTSLTRTEESSNEYSNGYSRAEEWETTFDFGGSSSTTVEGDFAFGSVAQEITVSASYGEGWGGNEEISESETETTTSSLSETSETSTGSSNTRSITHSKSVSHAVSCQGSMDVYPGYRGTIVGTIAQKEVFLELEYTVQIQYCSPDGVTINAPDTFQMRGSGKYYTAAVCTMDTSSEYIRVETDCSKVFQSTIAKDATSLYVPICDSTVTCNTFR